MSSQSLDVLELFLAVPCLKDSVGAVPLQCVRIEEISVNLFVRRLELNKFVVQ